MELSLGIDIGSTTLKLAGLYSDGTLAPIVIKELISDQPLPQILTETFREYTSQYGQPDYLGLTGSGQKLGAYILGTTCTATEIIAHAKGCAFLAKKLQLPPPKAIVEIGGQDSKLILLKDEVPIAFNMNSICSAGTGEFLRHTLSELSLPFLEFNQAVLHSPGTQSLEDTCTVFARRSFRHAGQNGVPLELRLKGLTEAILKNYLRTVAKNRSLPTPIYFLGGLSKCSAIALTLAELTGKTIIVPPHSQGIGALGMAVLAKKEAKQITSQLATTSFSLNSGYCQGCVNNCELTVLTNSTQTYFLGGRCESAGRGGLSSTLAIKRPTINKKPAPNKQKLKSSETEGWAIGLDAGSRQLKAALVQQGELIFLHTETTDSNLSEQVKKVLNLLIRHLPPHTPFSLMTTGSGGRYLSRLLAKDERLYETEIICHLKAANHIYPQVGSVIDVGGNDSKVIIQSSSSLDFAMNDRCAAGTGSFLEQLARRFDLSLGAATELALKSNKPARIASRCAVLAETDIIHKMRSGALPEDLLLGACYSLARTFISDTLHGRTLVTPVVFQGGAFLNAALLRAFIDLLGLKENEYHIAQDKRLLVGAGALGAALYASENSIPFGSLSPTLHYSKVGGSF